MDALSIYLTTLVAVTVMMLAGWLISLWKVNVTVVDSLWGLGFILIAWLAMFWGQGYAGRSLLLTLLVTLWGLRLSIYLSWRNWGEGEDPRYGAWRRKHGRRFGWVSLYKVFLIQAVVLWLIAMGLQHGILAVSPSRLTWLDGLGALIWLVGFGFESVGDWQLARFKADPANQGKVMDKGLWAYTRHPNYFGECLVWWGIFVVVLSTPGGAWTVISPLLITLVLLKMTGIALTEKSILEKRPAYREYINRTSAFVPWLPKEKGHECHDHACRSGAAS